MSLPPQSDSSTCLITGASAGIGVEIARQLAARGRDVTIVARRKDRLTKLAKELENDHGVRTETVSCDLSSAASRKRMMKTIEDRGRRVDVLVNNAGFGSGGRFQALDQESELQMVRTNVEAVVDLCGNYVPQMTKRGAGAVLNVASVASFQPLPRQTTYAATKAFVLSFSEALHYDVRGDGVTITALCPGPVKTEFGEVAGLDGELFELPGLVQTPDQVAQAGVSGLEKGRRVVIPGPTNVASAMGGRLAPRRLLLEVVDRLYPVGK